jgi:DNA-binding LacI/PurR family transcriptional regulator
MPPKANKTSPLYLRLKERLREDLMQAQATEGSSQVPTLEDLQARYAISRPTLSKALAALAAEGFLVKQAGRGTFALAPAHANSTAAGPRLTIGFIAPLYGAELPQHVFQGIDKIAHQRNCRVLMAGSGDNVDREYAAAIEMISAGARGLIVYPTVRQGGATEHEYLIRRNLGVPVVLIDTCTPEQGHAQVVFDNRRAGQQMARWLIEQGRKRIGLLLYSEEAHHPVIENRYRGYLNALREAGIAEDPELVFRMKPSEQADSLPSIVAKLLALEGRPNAIMAVDDLMAIDVIESLIQRGVTVPGEVLVTGFDKRAAAGYFKPSIPTTEPDFLTMGEVAAEMLLDGIAGNYTPTQTYMLPVPLVIREVAGAAR